MKENKIDKALKFAKSELGKYIQPCNTRGCKYNRNQIGDLACKNPNPAPDEDDIKKNNLEEGHPFWNFYCMRFVRTAYGAPGGYGSAEAMYQDLNKKGTINMSADIPLSALVFWHWSPYGHIGIYSGDGKVIHTGVNPNLKKRGIRESPIKDVTEVMNSYDKLKKLPTTYLGWAHPPDSWLK